MKHRLVSKKLSAIALGTILATSPLSVFAATTNYIGQNDLKITIEDGATIASDLDLAVTDVTNTPKITFKGAGTMKGLKFTGFDLEIDAAEATGAVVVDSAKNISITKATDAVTVTAATGDVEIAEVTGAVLVTEATGAVTVADASSTVDVVAAGGVEVTTAGSNVTIGDITGDVTVGAVTGDVSVATATGDVVVAEATALSVGDAASVTAEADVVEVEITGAITGGIVVDGADVAIADSATVDGDLTGRVGALTVEAPLTINATLTGVTAIEADVVLGADTEIDTTATITVGKTDAMGAIETPVSVEIASGVTVLDDQGVADTTASVTFEDGSSISSLTTSVSVDLGTTTTVAGTVVINPTDDETIEVLGTAIESADITIVIPDGATNVEVTLPNSVTEVGVVGSDENLSFKNENGTENTITVVQQAAAPVVTGSDVAFGEDIVVTFGGVVAEVGTSGQDGYVLGQSIYYTTNGSDPLVYEEVGGKAGWKITDKAVEITTDGDKTIANTAELDSVQINAVVAQASLSTTAAEQTIKPSVATKLTVSEKEADYSALSTTIAAAKLALAVPVIDTDAANVPFGESWVTQEVYDALNTAIGTAETALSAAAETSQEDIDALVDDLASAMSTFDGALQDGTKEEVVEPEEEEEEDVVVGDFTHEITVQEYVAETPASIEDLDDDTTPVLGFVASDEDEIDYVITVPADGGAINLEALVAEMLEDDATPATIDDGDEPTPAEVLKATWVVTSEEDTPLSKVSEYTEDGATGADASDLETAIATLTVAKNDAITAVTETLTVSYAKAESDTDAGDGHTAKDVVIKIAIAGAEIVDPTAITLTVADGDDTNEATPTVEDVDVIWDNVVSADVDAEGKVSLDLTAVFNSESNADPATSVVWTIAEEATEDVSMVVDEPADDTIGTLALTVIDPAVSPTDDTVAATTGPAKTVRLSGTAGALAGTVIVTATYTKAVVTDDGDVEDTVVSVTFTLNVVGTDDGDDIIVE